MRAFLYSLALVASVAWLVPYPNLLLLSSLVWIGVYFATLPKPRNDVVKRSRGKAL